MQEAYQMRWKIFFKEKFIIFFFGFFLNNFIITKIFIEKFIFSLLFLNKYIISKFISWGKKLLNQIIILKFY